jgi:hypothetical protein
MKQFIIAALLVICTGCNTQTGYYVYGDSLTANIEPSDSWASQLNQLRAERPNWGVPYFQWQAVPGMTLDEFELPTWIRPKNQITGLLIELGANDVMYGIPAAEYRAKMAQIVTQAREQGFSEVVCIVIVDIPADLVGVCDRILNIPLFLQDSPDGLHMGPLGSLDFGVQVLVKLGE